MATHRTRDESLKCRQRDRWERLSYTDDEANELTAFMTGRFHSDVELQTSKLGSETRKDDPIVAHLLVLLSLTNSCVGRSRAIVSLKDLDSRLTRIVRNERGDNQS